ncbi:hypothetical protein [Halorubrum sp. DM2]|uniref:hypothetical protein n=1 Tax=Halorubrum sp. DM2 TaxID=2527867 RepID=UPI0024B78105|nr:hypothetical protein [Halorubrum sp. DM2]
MEWPADEVVDPAAVDLLGTDAAIDWTADIEANVLHISLPATPPSGPDHAYVRLLPPKTGQTSRAAVFRRIAPLSGEAQS